MYIEKLIAILVLILTISCNRLGNGYPEYVALTESYKPIDHCYSIKIDGLDNLPVKTKEFIKSHLVKKLGSVYFNELMFDNGEVFSDKFLPQPESIRDLLGGNQGIENCQYNYEYPVYSLTFYFDLNELGIERIGLNLILDKNNKILDDIGYERVEFENIKFPIDSVRSALKRRNIPPKNLKINLGFNKESKTFSWNTYSVIREGSIAGPSCFPEYEYHFKMDSKTGMITKIKNRKPYIQKK